MVGRPRKKLPDTEIVHLYQEGHSEAKLAQRYQTSRSVIHRRLVSAGVPLRNAVEATALRTRKTFPVTEEFLELVDGLLLGDAWIEVNQNSEGRLGLQQTLRHAPWVDAVEIEFKHLNVSVNRIIRGPRTTIIKGKMAKGKGSVVLRTRKYVPFTLQRTRWYPGDEKKVPEDVRVSPRTLAHWYWGDGATVNQGYGMLFHTDGFGETGVELLRSKLKERYGWHTTQRERRPGQFTIGLYRHKARQELAELIGPYCPSCFTYKLKIKPKSSSKLSQVEEELRALRIKGWTQKQIAEHFQMRRGWGGWACRKLGI